MAACRANEPCRANPACTAHPNIIRVDEHTGVAYVMLLNGADFLAAHEAQVRELVKICPVGAIRIEEH
jgi:ferredoxin